MPAVPPRPLTLNAILLATLIAVLWGGNPVATRYSVDDIPPVMAAGLRFLIGSIFMIAWCRWEGSPIRMRRVDRVPCLVTGVLLFIQIGLFNVGVHRSTTSHSSLYINTFVFWVIAFEHFITRDDRLTVRKTAGLLLAAAGVFALLAPGGTGEIAATSRDAPTLLGDVILCLSALVLGIKVVYNKHVLKVVAPGTLVFWQSVVGTGLFFAWSLGFETLRGGSIGLPAMLGILYQGVFVAGVCFAVQARLIQAYSASRISMFAFLTPLAGVVGGVLMRGDAVSPRLLVAAAAIAGGIVCVNWSRRRIAHSSDSVVPRVESSGDKGSEIA
jgi:drug/metabolite transporter (DMT)-like permease